jgi:hypothetical protein
MREEHARALAQRGSEIAKQCGMLQENADVLDR